MRDLVLMWGNTRLVVLTAVSASLYAAILIPFKVMPIIPGVTEFRPANAIPILCSFLFGPAGAWGAAIGNVIGDFFGGFGPGDVFGFLGNLFYGALPYKAWAALTDAEPIPRSPRTWIMFAAVLLLASGACALTIGWGLNLLGFVPFSILGPVILVNNFAVAIVLAPALLAVIYPRVAKARLLYTDIAPQTLAPLWRRRLGLGLAVLAVAVGLPLGEMLSTGAVALPFESLPTTATGAVEVGLGLLPAIILLIIALALL
jgi:energy-coupling factor transport system substrate-specific component